MAGNVKICPASLAGASTGAGLNNCNLPLEIPGLDFKFPALDVALPSFALRDFGFELPPLALDALRYKLKTPGLEDLDLSGQLDALKLEVCSITLLSLPDLLGGFLVPAPALPELPPEVTLDLPLDMLPDGPLAFDFTEGEQLAFLQGVTGFESMSLASAANWGLNDPLGRTVVQAVVPGAALVFTGLDVLDAIGLGMKVDYSGRVNFGDPQNQEALDKAAPGLDVPGLVERGQLDGVSIPYQRLAVGGGRHLVDTADLAAPKTGNGSEIACRVDRVPGCGALLPIDLEMNSKGERRTINGPPDLLAALDSYDPPCEKLSAKPPVGPLA